MQNTDTVKNHEHKNSTVVQKRETAKSKNVNTCFLTQDCQCWPNNIKSAWLSHLNRKPTEWTKNN